MKYDYFLCFIFYTLSFYNYQNNNTMKQNILGNHTSKFMFLFVMLAVAMLSSCDNKDIARSKIEVELKGLKEELPIEIANGLAFQDIKIEDDLLCIDYTVTEAVKDDYMTLSDEAISSDKNIARVMESFGKQVTDILIEGELGMRLTYKIKETGKVVKSIDVTAERLKTIVKQLESGELKANSTLDTFKEEIKGMKFPIEVDELTVMKTVEVRGNNIHYILELKVDEVEISDSDVPAMKKEIIDNLSGTPLVLQKQNMIKEDIHIFYDYFDKNGNELVSIDIAPIELKTPENQ